jgi:class 3 adenylate cyclase
MRVCDECGASVPESARFCPACAAPIGAGIEPEEERKLATVLFADLVGSTASASDEDPERTRVRLDRFYDVVSSELVAAGGTVEKFAGDAVLAAFGVPSAHEDHAERALHAALSMQRRLRVRFGDELAIRIGVNTGEVVAGKGRAGSSFISGDPVNVAKRLEEAAAPGEILIGMRTAAAVGAAFELGETRQIEAKGKSARVAARPVRRALMVNRPRGVGHLRSTFVGRERELAELRGVYEDACARGEPRLVTIVGDAGVGKTRLVEETLAALRTSAQPPLQFTARCLAYGRGTTYSPLAEILREHFGFDETASGETVRSRLSGHEGLAPTLGLELGEPLHPLAARQRLEDAWVAFAEGLAEGMPVVLSIEDVQRAEEPLLDLLERLHREVRGSLLVIATSRPEFVTQRAGWGTRRGCSNVWLEPLDESATDRLVDELFATDLPEPIHRLVRERCEGNPFFVEEALSSLIDAGVLERDNGGWRTHHLPAGTSIPDSVQSVVASRIDLLEPAEKQALQAAAVVGRVFWPSAVYQLVAGAEPDLRTLEERDFIRRGSTLRDGEREYAFKHGLTRDVAYGSITRARRARLHATFAEWLEQKGPRGDEDVALLAHHYARAVRREDLELAWCDDDETSAALRRKALTWLPIAADGAIRHYGIGEALRLLHQALELESDDRAKARLWRRIGEAHALNYEGQAFREAFEQALAFSDSREERAELYAALALRTAARAAIWRVSPGTRRLVNEWIDRALALSASGTRARALALIARAYHDSDAAQEATAAAELLGDVELSSLAWGTRCNHALAGMRYEEAASWAERRLDVLEDVTDPDHRAEICWWAAYPALARGRFDEARSLARLQDEVASGLSAHHEVHCVSLHIEVEALAASWRAVQALEARAESAVEANVDTPCTANVNVLPLRRCAGGARRRRRICPPRSGGRAARPR